MEYRELFLSAITTLKTNAVRSALTMLGIIIGTSAVILIASIGQSSIAFITDELSQFGTNYFQIAPGGNMMAAFGGGSGDPLTIEDSDAIAAANIPNIESVAPIGFASQSVSANEEHSSVLVYGLTPEAQAMLKPSMKYGRDITDEDEDNKVIVLGIDVSEDLFGKDTDPVGLPVKINDAKYRVIGVSESSASFTGSFFNSAVIIPLSVMMREIRGDENLTEIDLSVADTNLLDETMEDVTQFLREKRNIREGEDNDFTLTSFKQSLGTIQTVTSLLTALIAGISAISLVVGGVGVMNIMLVSVAERTREIGLLKSIGARDEDILAQFLIESVIITVLGGVIGIFIGVSGSLLIAAVAGLPKIVSIPWIVIAVAVSAVVGIVFGLYPARRAARLSPIDALRHE